MLVSPVNVGNNTNVNLVKNTNTNNLQKQNLNNANITNPLKQDTFEKKEYEGTKIDMLSLFAGMLSNEQVEDINKNKKLAKGAVFQKNEDGDYNIVPDFCDLTKGTRILPEGYEVKNNFIGRTKVVPVGTKDIFSGLF